MSALRPSAITSRGDMAPELASIRDYYSAKVQRHGPTPDGVDWESHALQELRFAQLLRLCDFGSPFSLNDLGCGYGALLALLGRSHRRTPVDYLGIDVSEPMVRHARGRWRRRLHTAFVVADECRREADYSVASGIFNVKLDWPIEAWEPLVARTLNDLHRHSRYGFAVNFLLPAERGAVKVPQLYRPAVTRWRHYCDRALDCAVVLVGDYGLPEYTLLARPRSEARRLR